MNFFLYNSKKWISLFLLFCFGSLLFFFRKKKESFVSSQTQSSLPLSIQNKQVQKQPSISSQKKPNSEVKNNESPSSLVIDKTQTFLSFTTKEKKQKDPLRYYQGKNLWKQQYDKDEHWYQTHFNKNQKEKEQDISLSPSYPVQYTLTGEFQDFSPPAYNS